MAERKPDAATPSPGGASGGDGREWLAEESDAARKEGEARAKLAADVAVGIERTLKSFRQFGVRHKTSRSFSVDATKRVGVFHESHGELPLSVVGGDILYDGTSIYSDQELRTSYPFLLFRDGVQRVVIEKGVEESEIATFCQLLRDQSLLAGGVALEDDIVTLLWDADLHHLRYVVSENFKLEETDQEREDARKALVERLRTEAFRPQMDADVSARFVRSRPQDEQRAKDDFDVAASWERGNRIVADERARKALVESVDTDEVLLRKFLEIVFSEILAHADAKIRAQLVTLVRDFAVEATRRDRLPEAIGVLRALGDLARQSGAKGRAVAQEILAAIATPELLAELMHQLEIADDAGTEQLLTFLALMPAAESRRLLPLMPTITTAPRRRALCQLLAARLGDDLAEIGEQIRQAHDAVALDLVYLLRSSTSPRARVELLVALDSAAAVVRRAAYDALRKDSVASEPSLLGATLLCVEETDPELRRLALVSIPRQIDGDVARRLRVLIGRDTFDDWDYYDKRRAFLAYAAAAGKQRAGKELTEVLVARGVFAGEALEDRRCCAAIALASLGDESFLAVLESEQKRMFAGKRIKEACEAAISIVKFKRPADEDLKVAPIRLVAEEELEALPTAHLPGPIWDSPARSA